MEYFLLITFVCLFAIFSTVSKTSPLLFTPVIIALIIFAGTRHETGNDWGEYLKAFNAISSSPSEIFNVEHRMESGYILLNVAVKSMGGELWWVFFICSAFTITLIFASINIYTPFLALGLLLFMRYGYLQFDMMFVRQGMAVALFFFSIQYITSREIIKYISVLSIALLFHVSALILYPLYFFVHKEYSIYKVILLIIFCLIIGQTSWLEHLVNFLPIDGGKAAAIKGYVLSDVWGVPKLLSFSFFEKLIILCVAIKYFKTLKIKNSYFIIFFNFSVIAFCITLLFSNYMVFVDRLGIIFNISFIILISYFSYLMQQRDRILFIIVLCCFVTFWFVRYVHSGDTFIPYKSILF
ncbi:EpsG family protein [Shewanella sp. CAL98-MNA-CIBAN-0140]|uniref:EpsG family protein n=1 Tax=Shewanella sp. CAL98-MNA-CIBAN-0140 TaxID=3140462 RepID=UPI00331861D5